MTVIEISSDGLAALKDYVNGSVWKFSIAVEDDPSEASGRRVIIKPDNYGWSNNLPNVAVRDA